MILTEGKKKIKSLMLWFDWLENHEGQRAQRSKCFDINNKDEDNISSRNTTNYRQDYKHFNQILKHKAII